MVSVVPPAMWNSSSVPTMRSKKCSVACSFARHLGALDEAALALAVAGDAPEVRAVVDVERGPRAVLAGELQRLQHRRLGARMAEMGPGCEHRPGLGDEALVDVLLGQPHVGAVLAIEDQREPLVVADAEDDQRGQPLGVDLHPAGVHALAGQLLDDEAAHVLVADPGDHCGLQPQPRRAAGDVGRRAPDVLRERAHVLEPPADLVAVEVDRRPADGDEVQRLRHQAPLPNLRACRPALRPRPLRQFLGHVAMLSRSAASGSARPCTSGANGSKLYGPSKPRATSSGSAARSPAGRRRRPAPGAGRASLDRDVGIDDARDVDDAGPLREELGFAGEMVVEGVVHQLVDVGAPRLVDRLEACRLVRIDETGKPSGSTSPVSPRSRRIGAIAFSAATRSACDTGVPSLSGHMTSALAPAALA